MTLIKGHNQNSFKKFFLKGVLGLSKIQTYLIGYSQNISLSDNKLAILSVTVEIIEDGHLKIKINALTVLHIAETTEEIIEKVIFAGK